MPVQTPHSLYSENLPIWQRCRILSSGQRAVKNAGTEFLPKLSGQDSPMYESYLKRAYYFNASGRTVDGLTGVVFRKPPQVKFPESHLDFLESVNLEGSPFESFSRRVFKNVVMTGRHGVLLDIEDGEAGALPYFESYSAEAIINWRMEKIDGKTRLSLVVLQEEVEVLNIKDEFVRGKQKQLRVLRLLPTRATDDGGSIVITGPDTAIPSDSPIYKVEIWIENPKQVTREEDKYILDSVVFPMIRGAFISYIPFVFMGPTESSMLIQKPMIEDLCDVNESHFHSSADIEHGRHFTALPTAWVAGFNPDQELVIGSQTAWVTENPDARAGFLEYTGQGLQALENAMNSKEAQMAILGARMLEVPRKAVEAEGTHAQRQAGEQSVLASAAASVEAGFTTILIWTAQWLMATEDPDVEVEFNKDYMPKGLEPQMLTALFAVLQANRMSWETFAYNLQQGELYPDGHTSEEELELILAQKPDEAGMELEEEETEETT